MVFPDDVSDVPLTKDIIRKEKKFTPTFNEFIILNASEKIHIRTSLTGGASSSTIIEVPSNQDFYLYSAQLNLSTISSGVAGFLTMVIGSGANPDEIMTASIEAGDNQKDTLLGVYPHMIKLSSGESLILTVAGSTNLRSESVVIGYLVPKDIITFL